MTAKEKLDILFSQYIRKKYAVNGYVRCFTCGTNAYWRDIENGHYIDRRHNSVRYNEYNCHPQCIKCNRELRGNIEVYREKLIEKYGKYQVLILENQKNDIVKMGKLEIEELATIYKTKLKCNNF